jgi:hypothetical protein
MHDFLRATDACRFLLSSTRVLVMGLVTSVDKSLVCTSMTHVEARHYLRKNAPDEFLRKVLTLFQTLTDYFLEVASLTVLHNNVNFKLLLINRAVIIPHYVRMLQLTQDVDLCHDLLLLFLIHFAIV